MSSLALAEAAYAQVVRPSRWREYFQATTGELHQKWAALEQDMSEDGILRLGDEKHFPQIDREACPTVHAQDVTPEHDPIEACQLVSDYQSTCKLFLDKGNCTLDVLQTEMTKMFRTAGLSDKSGFLGGGSSSSSSPPPTIASPRDVHVNFERAADLCDQWRKAKLELDPKAHKFEPLLRTKEAFEKECAEFKTKQDQHEKLYKDEEKLHTCLHKAFVDDGGDEKTVRSCIDRLSSSPYKPPSFAADEPEEHSPEEPSGQVGIVLSPDDFRRTQIVNQLYDIRKSLVRLNMAMDGYAAGAQPLAWQGVKRTLRLGESEGVDWGSVNKSIGELDDGGEAVEAIDRHVLRLGMQAASLYDLDPRKEFL